jgi:hypothetical protein
VILTVLGFDLETNTKIRAVLDTIFKAVHDDITVRILALTFSALMIFIISSITFFAVKFGRRDRTFKIESPYGEVKISIGAIEDYINNIKSELAGVKEIKPRVYLRKGKLKIYIRVSLYSDNDIGDLSVLIQNGIKVYLSNIIGEEMIGSIKLFVNKIIYRGEQSPKNYEYPDKSC